MNRLLLLLLPTLLVSIFNGQAQVEFVTTPPPCLPSYGSSTYHLNFQSINPPISPSTPRNVLLAYTVMDSVAKRAGFSKANEFLSRQTLYNDTVKKMLKYWFEAVDDNPISYLAYVSNRDSNVIASPAKIMGAYQIVLYNTSPHKIEDLLLGSSVIVVKGLVTSSTIDQVDSNADFTNSQTLTVRVLETIKGRSLPLHYCGTKAADASSREHGVQISGSVACLNVDIRPHLTQQMKLKNPGLDGSLYVAPTVDDTCFFFLRAKLVSVCIDGIYCAFTPIHQPANLGVYRVVNGFVITPMLEFTGLPVTSEGAFVSGILSHITRIKSY